MLKQVTTCTACTFVGKIAQRPTFLDITLDSILDNNNFNIEISAV